MTLRVLLADDEPLVRLGLRSVIASEPGFAVVGEARNGREAQELLGQLQPDVLFLDVYMPVRDGFDVLASIPPQSNLVIVFVTAHQEHAVRAFDLNAADYLLKPFDADRVRLALARARARFTSSENANAPLVGRSARAAPIDHLLLKQAGRVRVVPLDTIRWIDAAGNYVRVHTTLGVFRMRSTLGDLLTRLSPQRFGQIHRSTIANLKYVRELVPLSSGESDVILDTGDRLTLSRTFRDAVRDRLARQSAGAHPAGPRSIPP